MDTSWFTISNAAEIASPALLVYPDRVEENIRRMIRMAGGAERLRPHIKTNKLPEVIRMQMDQGITKFKCATIAEAEMVAACGAPDVLLAYQAVGPNIHRLIQLVRTFPGTGFSALADDEGTIRALSGAAVSAGVTVNLFLDLDCGMHRTGVAPGPGAVELYRLISLCQVCMPPACTRTTGMFTTPIWTPVLERATYRSRRSRPCAMNSLTADCRCQRWSPAALQRFPFTRSGLTSSAVPARRSSGIWDTAPRCPTWISFRPSSC